MSYVGWASLANPMAAFVISWTEANIRVTTKEKELLQSKDQADEMSLGKFLIAASCLKWTSEAANWDR